MFVIDCVFFSPLIHVRFFGFVIVYARNSIFLRSGCMGSVVCVYWGVGFSFNWVWVGLIDGLTVVQIFCMHAAELNELSIDLVCLWSRFPIELNELNH